MRRWYPLIHLCKLAAKEQIWRLGLTVLLISLQCALGRYTMITLVFAIYPSVTCQLSSGQPLWNRLYTLQTFKSKITSTYTNSTLVPVTPVCIAARGALERTDQLQPRHNAASAPLAEYNATLSSWKQCSFQREASYCGSGGVWVYVVRCVCRYVWVCRWLPPLGEP